jgi:hypothetical protein
MDLQGLLTIDLGYHDKELPIKVDFLYIIRSVFSIETQISLNVFLPILSIDMQSVYVWIIKVGHSVSLGSSLHHVFFEIVVLNWWNHRTKGAQIALQIVKC